MPAALTSPLSGCHSVYEYRQVDVFVSSGDFVAHPDVPALVVESWARGKTGLEGAMDEDPFACVVGPLLLYPLDVLFSFGSVCHAVGDEDVRIQGGPIGGIASVLLPYVTACAGIHVPRSAMYSRPWPLADASFDTIRSHVQRGRIVDAATVLEQTECGRELYSDCQIESIRLIGPERMRALAGREAPR